MAALLGVASPAAADPPGPTDYRTTIVSVEPAAPGLSFTVVGGDSFLLIEVDPGIRVEVAGYEGEPYLRVLADGIVERNERSPARWLNDDRYGAVPAAGDPDAAPEWHRVGTSGRYAWHDHRAHWMNEQRPPGAEPGDVVLEAVIPVVVDGTPVAVTVRSVLVAAPSRLPVLAGALVGAGVVVAAVAAGRDRGRPYGIVGPGGLAAVAIAAAILGGWGYRSIPTVVGPSLRWWVPAVLAALAALGAVALAGNGARGAARRARATPAAVGLLMLLAAVELLVWAWPRRQGLWRPVLPTSAPPGLERAVVAAALVAGIGVSVAVLTEGVLSVRPRAARAGRSGSRSRSAGSGS